VFTVVPFGTGSDLIRSLLIPRDVEQALTVARAGRTRPADVGHLSATALAGNPSERFFINEVSFGMGGEVVARVNRSSKRLGGFASFLGATVGALAQFRPQRVELAWEGPAGPGTWEGELTNAFLANGHFCGGGMLVGKGGSMFDGLFDLTVLPPMSLATSAANLPRLYRGTSHEARGAFRVPVTRLAARCLAPEATVLVDSDGEQPGRLPLVARVVPGALRIRGRWTDDAPPAV
jgi:diacylglycerol kinase family enzyme